MTQRILLIALILLSMACARSPAGPDPSDPGREVVLAAARAFLEARGSSDPVHPGTDMEHQSAQRYLAWLLTDWSLPAACTEFDALWVPLCDEGLLLELVWTLETGDGFRLLRWDVPNCADVVIPCP